MSQWHEIFCKSTSPVTRALIADAASETWYGEGVLQFSPERGDSSIDDSEWDRLTVNVPGLARPILFSRGVGDSLLQGLLEDIEDKAGDLPKNIQDGITGASQVIGVEFFPEYMDDDSWEMLDLVQSFVMRQADGILLTPDGIYDKNLQVMLEID